VPFSDQLQDTYHRSLASSITVTTTLDEVDSDTTSFDSLLLDFAAGNDISLREAIMAANAQPGADTIVLPAGSYNLTIGGNFTSGDDSGDHDITSDVTITGAGSGATTVSASGFGDRVIEVHPGASLNINDLTIEDGSGKNGSGISNSGTLTTNNIAVQNNTAGSRLGGALWNEGTANLNFTEILFNSANSGGGIYNSSTGDITLTSSTVLGNVSSGQGAGLINEGTAQIVRSVFLENTGLNGGAISTDGGTTTILNSTFNGNSATSAGGAGVFNKSGDTIIRYSTFAENDAKNTGAAVWEQAGTVTIGSSIFADNTVTTPWGAPDIDSVSFSEGHNIIKSTEVRGSVLDTTTDQTGVDPQLLPLDFYNNSPTKTHALDINSPAINAGGGSPPALDQRGIARDALPDIGAHERSSSLPAPNAAPVITPSLTTTSYTENTNLIIDSSMSITDSDSPDFDTGTLTITNSGFNESADEIYITPVGTGPGEIDVIGASVLYEGIQIGTWSGGVGTAPLQIDFNAASSLAAVNALTQNIGFTNNSENPTNTARTLTYEISDGDGKTSAPIDITVDIVTSNDPPTIIALANNVTVDEDMQLTLSVTSGSLARSSTPAIFNPNITIIGTQADINAELDGLSYRPNNNYNGTDNLLITIEDQDVAGSLSSSEKIVIQINPVNDAPTLTLDSNGDNGSVASGYHTTFAAGSLPIAAVDTDAKIEDVDSTTLTHLVVTIANPLDGAAESLISSVSIPNYTESYNTATHTLTITNGAGTLADFNTILGGIKYSNTSISPDTTADRTLAFSVSDYTGNTDAAQTTINITADATAPTINGSNSGSLDCIT